MSTLYDHHSFKVVEASFREKDVVYFGMLYHSLKTCILLLLVMYNRFCWLEGFFHSYILISYYFFYQFLKDTWLLKTSTIIIFLFISHLISIKVCSMYFEFQLLDLYSFGVIVSLSFFG